MKKFLKNENIIVNDLKEYIPAFILPASFNMLGIMIFTRLLSKGDFGEFNLFISTTAILVTFFSQWIIQSIHFYRPLYKNNNLQLFNNYLFKLVNINLGIIIIFFALIYGILLIVFKEINNTRYLLLGLFYILGNVLFLIGIAVFQSDLSIKLYRTFNILLAFLKFIFSICLLFIFKDPYSIILGYSLAYLILLPFVLYFIKLNNTKINDSNSHQQFKTFMKNFFRYGFPMIGWFLAGSILNLSDRYILNFLSNKSSVGVYGASYSLAAATFGVIVSPIISAAHPRLMNLSSKINTHKESIEKEITKYTRIYSLLLIPLAFFLFLFGEYLIVFFLGHKYSEGTTTFLIIILGILIWNFSLIGHKGLELFKKTKLMFYLLVVCAVTNIILNILLIPTFDYLGAAISTLICFTLYPILVYFVTKKYIRWVLPTKSIIKIICGSSISAFVVKNIFNIFHVRNTLMEMIVIIILFLLYLLIYVIVLFLIKEIKLSFIKKYRLSKN